MAEAESSTTASKRPTAITSSENLEASIKAIDDTPSFKLKAKSVDTGKRHLDKRYSRY